MNAVVLQLLEQPGTVDGRRSMGGGGGGVGSGQWVQTEMCLITKTRSATIAGLQSYHWND